MSFDTIFDYSASIANLNDAVANFTAQLVSCNANLALYTTVTGFEDLTATIIESLTSQQSSLQTSIDGLQAVLTEIANVTSSPSNVKDMLYQYFTIVQSNRLDFMKRMPFNYEAALADPNIIALMADTTNSDQAKNALALLIYNQYPMKAQYAEAINLIVLP